MRALVNNLEDFFSFSVYILSVAFFSIVFAGLVAYELFSERVKR